MTPRFLYSCKFAPIGKPVRLKIAGERLGTQVLDEFCLPLASRAKIRISHGETDVGQVGAAIAWRGWHVADFMLDPRLVDEETERMIEVGQPVSACFTVTRSTVDAEGVEQLLECELEEISLVQRSAIPGAQITGKRAMKPAPVVSGPRGLGAREQARVNALVAQGWPREHLEKLAAESDPLRWRVTHPRDIGALLELGIH